MGVKEKAFSFLRVLDMDYMKRLLSIMAISLLFSPICLGKDSNELPDLFTMVKEVIQLRIDEANKPLQQLPMELKAEVDVIKQESYPQPPTLVKDEFESTINFKRRAEKAEKEYQAAVQSYNNRLDRVERKVEEFYKNLPQLPKWRRNAIIEQTLLGILGNPQVENVRYDADTQTFFLDVTSDSPVAEDYRIPLALEEPIPNDAARAFKYSLQTQASPEVSFSLENGNIGWGEAHVVVNDQRYKMARLSDESSVSVAAETMSFTPQTVKSQVQSVLDVASIREKNLYSGGTQIEFTDNAELTAEQKRVLELRKRVALEEKRAYEKERLLAEERALKERLRSIGKGYASLQDDIPNLLKEAGAKPVDHNKWLFAVAISDYDEAPDVTYADRSGEAFIETMKRSGIPDENIVQLIDERATGTRIISRLRRILNQLGPDDTLYFYYAGHGVPSRKKAASYLLPSDGDIGSYEDPKLETNQIYELLANSSVGHAVVFMDACFSGRADMNQLVFDGVAGIVMKQRVKVDTNKITLLTAGKVDQFANQDEVKGHRLFSYYLIRGLLESDFSLSQVAEYVQRNVSRESRKLGLTYTQEPEVYGLLN